MDLLIGCPVSRRGWAIPSWLYYVEKACEVADLSPQYVFACDPRDPTGNFLLEMNRFQKRKTHFVWTNDERETDKREWNDARFQHMVAIRNLLLKRVRLLEPRYFLSLDSDILLHPDALTNLIELTTRFDAVGGKCYMTPGGTQFPSNGIATHDGFMRIDGDDVMTVDIIMGIKLMTPVAYNVDYKFNKLGEDLGWSENCRLARLKLGWDGRVTSKHVMSVEALLENDPRAGF